MNVRTLSGWGQPAGALCGIVPSSAPIAYAHEQGAEAALELIAREASGAHTLIGWSLGGYLLVRAVAEKRIAPKKLVLVAAPYQFVQSPELPLGMGRDTFVQFRLNYAQQPQRTLHRAHALVVKGDASAADIRHHQEEARVHMEQSDWGAWLDVLADAGCDGFDFSHFPPTLLLHGENDAVVEARQAEYFAQKLPNAELCQLPACGHAPHWHNPALIREKVCRFHAL